MVLLTPGDLETLSGDKRAGGRSCQQAEGPGRRCLSSLARDACQVQRWEAARQGERVPSSSRFPLLLYPDRRPQGSREVAKC